MNTWDDLESRLLSWKPRRPSARLETVIFGRQGINEERACASGTFPFALIDGMTPHTRNWLASALGCCVLVGVMFSQSGSSLARRSGDAGARLAGVALSNESAAAYFTAALHSGHNGWWQSWSAPLFGLDNPARSHTSNGSFASWKTNMPGTK
jgi:hypothetical protein